MAPGGGKHPGTCTIHATTVAYGGSAALIRGGSGSGKSTLALRMIALGARLIADDRTILRRHGQDLIASCPATLEGKIEARGMGILAVPSAPPTKVALIVDMDSEETDRLPPMRQAEILGIALPLQKKIDLPHFPAALLSYLEHGRIA